MIKPAIEKVPAFLFLNAAWRGSVAAAFMQAHLAIPAVQAFFPTTQAFRLGLT